MSVQPFNTFRQADDFFNVFLHTSNCINSNATIPRWRINASGAVCDRYKMYKKCIAVVNYLCMDDDVISGATAGDSYVIRDVSNQQMNSSDSITNQSNIIYVFTVDGTNVLQSPGFPYEKANPFGEQDLSISVGNTATASTIANAKHWGVHITYYFYMN